MNPTIKARIESIRRGEVPEGYKRTKIGIVPNEWGEERLKHYFKRLTRKNSEKNQNVLTISAQYGLISQEEFFNKSVASEDKSNYFLLNKGDFAYNKSYSNGYPYGAIKRLEYYEKGIVSPLYICLESLQEKTSDYFVQYFEAGLLNKEIHAVAQEGARNHGLLNIAVEDFFNSRVVVPKIPEQEKIAEILAGQDRVIALKEKLLAEKQKQKKYLMQQLLTGKKRLPGFSCEWRIVKLKEVLRERDEKNVAQNLEICSVAVQKGVVNQIEHLGRSFAASDTSNYNVVRFGDIVYTKSPTGEFPFGIIKQSQLDKAAVSPLYGVFKPITYALGYILHCYFEIPINTNNYLNPIIQKGAKNTINISNVTFLSNKLLLPMDKQEQTAIAEILSAEDKEIELLQKDVEQEKLKKKSLMQLLLTGIVRVNELVS